MSDDTQMRAGIEEALKAAGHWPMSVWDVTEDSARIGLGNWEVTITADYVMLYDPVPIGHIAEYRADYEVYVALVRGVMASGWKAEVARLGVVPEIEPMLTRIFAYGGIPAMSYSDDCQWCVFLGDAPYRAESLTEAVAKCLLDIRL